MESITYDIQFLNGAYCGSQESASARWGLTDVDGCHDGINTFHIEYGVEVQPSTNPDSTITIYGIEIRLERISHSLIVEESNVSN